MKHYSGVPYACSAASALVLTLAVWIGDVVEGESRRSRADHAALGGEIRELDGSLLRCVLLLVFALSHVCYCN